jgi:AcrR family transcriptional regulator
MQDAQVLTVVMPLQVVSTVSDRELVDKRRAQIVRAATELFGERGYYVTTVRDIALRADVSIGLIYQYFKEKEDVLFLVLREVLDSYQREIPKVLEGVTNPLARLRAAVHAYCRVNDANADATVLAYRETKSLRPERRRLMQQQELATNIMLAACVDDCIKAGLLHKVDKELFVYQIVMFSHAWALKAWRFHRLMTVDQYVDRGLDLMLNAVLTEAGGRAYRRRMPPGTRGRTERADARETRLEPRANDEDRSCTKTSSTRLRTASRPSRSTGRKSSTRSAARPARS